MLFYLKFSLVYSSMGDINLKDVFFDVMVTPKCPEAKHSASMMLPPFDIMLVFWSFWQIHIENIKNRIM